MENGMQKTNEIEAPQRDIETVTSEIKNICQQAQAMALMYAIEIGRRLKEAKAILPHGEWGDWLKEKVEFSQSSANNFMRIFEEYGSDQISLFGQTANSQTLGNLPYTKALKLLAIPAEDRDEFVKENDVENLSSRELERLIRERDEANKRAEEADRRAASAEAEQEQYKRQQEFVKNAQEQIDLQKKAASAAEDQAKALQEQMKQLNEKLDKAKEAEKKAKEKANELKNNPTVPQEIMDKLKADAAAAAAEEAKKKTESAIEEANRKIGEALKQKAIAERAAKEAEERAEELRKKAEMANPDVIEFKTVFTQAQEDISRLKTLIERIRSSDEAVARKLSAAFSAFIIRCN